MENIDSSSTALTQTTGTGTGIGIGGGTAAFSLDQQFQLARENMQIQSNERICIFFMEMAMLSSDDSVLSLAMAMAIQSDERIAMTKLQSQVRTCHLSICLMIVKLGWSRGQYLTRVLFGFLLASIYLYLNDREDVQWVVVQYL